VNRIALAGIPPDDIAAMRRTLLAMMENLAGDPFFAERAAESLNGLSGLDLGDTAKSEA
jgi:hypothetical protein